MSSLQKMSKFTRKSFKRLTPGVKLLKLFLWNVCQNWRELIWGYDGIIINYELKKSYNIGLETNFILFEQIYLLFLWIRTFQSAILQKNWFSLQKCVRKFIQKRFYEIDLKGYFTLSFWNLDYIWKEELIINNVETVYLAKNCEWIWWKKF